jgi:8-oxo-dGTP pyrophosphatase MutT (NUDIX family)
MLNTNLCYLLKDNKILLGMKKRGFGEGKWNGYGGKKEPNETIEEATVRELHEEAGMKVAVEHLDKVGEIDFFFTNAPEGKNWDQTVHIFFAREWQGEAKETEEMKPQWFETEKIPINNMWADDPHWLPEVIKGKRVKAQFTFGETSDIILKKNVEFINKFD